MIKFFEDVCLDKLEYAVNEYIKTCDFAIREVQYRATDGNHGLYYTVCIVHGLDFLNLKKL